MPSCSLRQPTNVLPRFLAQQVLIKSLDDAAKAVKTSDNKMKQKELTRRMGELDAMLNGKHTLIPLSASLLAKGVDGRSLISPLIIRFRSISESSSGTAPTSTRMLSL